MTDRQAATWAIYARLGRFCFGLTGFEEGLTCKSFFNASSRESG